MGLTRFIQATTLPRLYRTHGLSYLGVSKNDTNTLRLAQLEVAICCFFLMNVQISWTMPLPPVPAIGLVVQADL